MSDELRECPFCGDTATLYDYDTELRGWHIVCNELDCGARVISSHSREHAIAKWNRRPLEQAAPVSAWEPVPDGEYTMPRWSPGETYTLEVTDGASELAAWLDGPEHQYKDGSPKNVAEIGLGDFRLCRQVAATQAEPPAMPQDGAQWTPVAEYAYTEHLNMGPGKPSKWQRVEVRGRMITIDRDDTGMHAALLPEGMGVCRITPASPAPEGVTPLISNDELDRMVSAIRDETSRDSAYELLVRVRGMYERERQGLKAQRPPASQPPAMLTNERNETNE